MARGEWCCGLKHLRMPEVPELVPVPSSAVAPPNKINRGPWSPITGVSECPQRGPGPFPALLNTSGANRGPLGVPVRDI
eukprot:2769715-Pyramimonas_sp.AAC.1